MDEMKIMRHMVMLDKEPTQKGPLDSAFICYSHEDNQSSNSKERWLDRFLQFIRPLTRQEQLRVWSDKEIKIGDEWHTKIQAQLHAAKAIVLFVSPAFLASDYIAKYELPVLLMQAKDRGVPIFQLLISPCLDAETKFKYPDPKTGPNEFSLLSIQAANAPSKTLIEMSEAEQNRVLLEAARALWKALSPDATQSGPLT